jgi:putative oxidoreductase
MPMKPFEGVKRQRQLSTIELGCTLQRLFSTFPDSWPGLGLLVLRISLSIALIYFVIAGLPAGKPSESIPFARDLIAALAGFFLIAGLWTPVMGSLVAVDEIWIALSLYSSGRAEVWVHLLLAILSVSVAMLGPGAWSIDARLFGRKRFDIDRTKGRRSSP